MALYWFPKKLTKEKDLGGCQWLPAQKSNRVYFFNCSNQTFLTSPSMFSRTPSHQYPESKVPRDVGQRETTMSIGAFLTHSCGLDQLTEIRVKETGWSIIRLFCWSPNSSNSTSGCVRKTNRDNGIFTLLSSLSRSIRERLLLCCGRSEP